MPASRSLLFAILAAAATPAAALDLRVGTGAGCTHATLQAALNALVGVDGNHTIRLNAGDYAVPDGMVWQPAVPQGTLLIEGGYSDCHAMAPSGSADEPSGRTLFDGAGGVQRSVLTLRPFQRAPGDSTIDRIELRRVVLTGGDALASWPANHSMGGGLAVHGRGLVHLRAGTRIIGNRARDGGGIALVGSPTRTSEPLVVARLLVSEGALIANNVAQQAGGGIYCGGATGWFDAPQPRHGFVVLGESLIFGNRAATGSAIECVGSWAAGGVVWAVPKDTVASIRGNHGTDPWTETCAVRTQPHDALLTGSGIDGFGSLEFANNVGYGSAGVCIVTPHDRGGADRDPPPHRAGGLNLSRFFNARFVGNRVAYTPAIKIHSAALRSERALGATLEVHSRWDRFVVTEEQRHRCATSIDRSCLVFDANGPIGPYPTSPANTIVAVAVGHIQIMGARFTRNEAHVALLTTERSHDRLWIDASVIDHNSVSSGDASLFRAHQGSATVGQFVRVSFVTTTRNVHRSFVSIEGPGRAEIRASLLHTADGLSPPVRVGSAGPGALTLTDCLYVPRLLDPSLTGATLGTSEPGPVLMFDGPIMLGSDFAPPAVLRDRCHEMHLMSTLWPRTLLAEFSIDFYGRSRRSLPSGARLNDIGAVEFVP